MTVTDIASLDNKRVRVFVDGEFAFVLYKGEIRDFGLRTGEDISSPVFDEIKNVVLPKRAKLRAMNLLQKRDYTEYKIREKLREGYYGEDIIDEAVDYLKSFRYIDDERYAEDYVRYHMQDRSRNRIKQDLMQKGISTELLDRILDTTYCEETQNPEIELCRTLLKKKHFDPDLATYEEKQKLKAFLYRKGFGTDVIESAMSLDTMGF